MYGFGETLSSIREGAGFANASAFYKSRDGRRSLGISFANYVKIEKGRRLPKPHRLEPLLAALGLELSSPLARSLLRAYLKDLLGSERLLDAATEASGSDPAPHSWILAERAARQVLSQRAHQITLDQYRVLARDKTAYALHVILANTAAWLEKAELVRLTGAPPAAVSRSLAALAKAGMAELKGRDVRSPLAGRYVVPPSPSPVTASFYASLRRHRQDWPRKPLHAPYLILRASAAQMEKYFLHLGEAVSLSALYGDVKPGKDSGLYLVEASVARLFER